jgi:hypothetical protein
MLEKIKECVTDSSLGNIGVYSDTREIGRAPVEANPSRREIPIPT